MILVVGKNNDVMTMLHLALMEGMSQLTQYF